MIFRSGKGRSQKGREEGDGVKRQNPVVTLGFVNQRI